MCCGLCGVVSGVYVWCVCLMCMCDVRCVRWCVGMWCGVMCDVYVEYVGCEGVMCVCSIWCM